MIFAIGSDIGGVRATDPGIEGVVAPFDFTVLHNRYLLDSKEISGDSNDRKIERSSGRANQRLAADLPKDGPGRSTPDRSGPKTFAVPEPGSIVEGLDDDVSLDA
jgi:hypothetical protein